MPVEQFTLTPERIAEAGHLIYSNPWIPKVRWPQSAQIHGDDCGPTPAQLPFLLYFGPEAFFGGAAGPGKSWALLAAAAMFVDQPGYHALLLRRTYADLAKPGALIERSKEWWKNTEAKWSEKDKKWTFPSGATIGFGYLEHEDDKYQYQSAEYQFIGFDELTQFSEQQYLYLFSRLRKLEGSNIPLRMRAASNPGGPKGGRGHEWVKARFVDPESAVAPFFRGVLSTNFFLDRKQYLQSLSHLDPVTRGQLERGDWSSVPGGRFFREWFKKYRCYRDGHGMLRLVLEDGDKTGLYLHECYTFIAADIACSMKQTADYTAIGVFAVTPGKQLLIIDMIRERTRVDMIVPLIAQACKDYSPLWVGIEDAGFQQAILAEAKRNRTIPAVRGLKHMGLDKLVRATPAMIRASEGQVYVPSNSEDSRIMAQQQVPMDCKWVEQFVAECVTFTGDPDDGKDDMVDSFAYACRQLDMHGLLGPIVVTVDDDPVPRHSGGGLAAIGYDDGNRASGFVEMIGR